MMCNGIGETCDGGPHSAKRAYRRLAYIFHESRCCDYHHADQVKQSSRNYSGNSVTHRCASRRKASSALATRVSPYCGCGKGR